jgi:hypothetical protein
MKSSLPSCLLLIALPVLAADPADREIHCEPERTDAAASGQRASPPRSASGLRPARWWQTSSRGRLLHRVVSRRVGPDGKVTAKNIPYATFDKDAIKTRRRRRLKNVDAAWSKPATILRRRASTWWSSSWPLPRVPDRQ